jgi:hypothetical protein
MPARSPSTPFLNLLPSTVGALLRRPCKRASGVKHSLGPPRLFLALAAPPPRATAEGSS